MLVVDDEATNRAYSRGYLQRAGCQVEEVVGGHISTGEFDLVLMDLPMPQMDGYEAGRQIRRQDGCWILKSI